jgi:hypothetical protein
MAPRGNQDACPAADCPAYEEPQGVCAPGFSLFPYGFLMNQQVFARFVRFRLDNFLNAK